VPHGENHGSEGAEPPYSGARSLSSPCNAWKACCEAPSVSCVWQPSTGHACPSLLNVFGQSGAAMAPIGRKIGSLYLFIKFLALAATNTLGITKPLVVGTMGHFQNSAHQLDRPSSRLVVLNKPEDQRPLLEMMLKAFFNMSRSVSASISRFFKSHNSLASEVCDWTPLSGKLCGPFSRYSLRHRGSIAGQHPTLVRIR